MDFFKQFNVVLNGLDNLDARRHVNRLCLASGVPLVESGTTGFLGQVRISLSVLFDGDQATKFHLAYFCFYLIYLLVCIFLDILRSLSNIQTSHDQPKML